MSNGAEDNDERDGDLDISESSVSSAPPVVDMHRCIQGSKLLGTVAHGDLITEWPDPIPAYLLYPPYDARHTNPYLNRTSSAPDPTDRPTFLHRILPLLGLTLSATFNVPRRAAEMAMKVAASAVRLGERQLFARLYAALEKDPDATPALLQRIQALNPAPALPIAPKTLAAALNRLQLDDSIVVNPQCRNEDCFHVFYQFTIPEDVKALPVRCSRCGTPLRDANNRPTFLHFGRRTMQAELQTVMMVPGVEDALERRAARKESRDREDAEMLFKTRSAGFTKVYREQDDGSAWSTASSGPSYLIGALSLTVNLAVDWANASSNRSAATHSMGPITLTIADLPSHMRSSLACILLVGITPGPKPPRSKNLYKLLQPLALEIRSANQHGL